MMTKRWLLASAALSAIATPVMAQDAAAGPQPAPATTEQQAPATQGPTESSAGVGDAAQGQGAHGPSNPATGAGSGAPGTGPAGGPVQTQAETGVGDIVVTANRVVSSAQRTATALTVYSGNALLASGVTSVANLQQIDPSVNFTQKNGSGYIAIRGITSADTTEIADPAVPIARDGFFVNRPFSVATSFYDLQRVEVLKGPQGTLFGRNSVGGLVSLVSKEPGKNLGGEFNLELGNYKTVRADGGFDVPVADWAQVRVAGIVHRHDGYRNLTDVDIRGDDDQTLSGRVTLLLTPFQGFKGTIQYQHDDINEVGDVSAVQPLAQPLPKGFDSKRFPNYAPTQLKIIGDRVRWEASYSELPLGLTLTYAGGRDVQRYFHLGDASGSSVNRANFYSNEHPVTWNHEIRLATPQDGLISGQVGFFHFQEKNGLHSYFVENTGPFVGQTLIDFRYNVLTRSDAGFGQFSIHPLQSLKITGGARYTWDKKVRTGTSALRCDIAGIPAFLYGVIGCIGTPPVLPGLGDGRLKEHKPTYLAGVEWTPTSHNFVYAKFSTGYKSGGFNSNGSAPSVPYDAETSDAYEVGVKNSFFGNAVHFNVDGFYQTYKGYQANQATPAVSSGSGIFNVGSAKIYGAEAEIVAVYRGLRLNANGTYLHARFDKNVNPVITTDVNTGQSISVDISGNRLPNAPTVAVSAGLEYQLRLGNGTLTPRIDGRYSSSYYYSAFNNADERQGHFATGNILVTYEPESKHWSLGAFVRNFTDATILSNAQRFYGTTPGNQLFQFQPPRTYGVRMGYHF